MTARSEDAWLRLGRLLGFMKTQAEASVQNVNGHDRSQSDNRRPTGLWQAFYHS